MQLYALKAKLSPIDHTFIYSPDYLFSQQISFASANPLHDEMSQPLPKGYVMSQWQVNEMDCPTEVTLIEKALMQLPTVKQVTCSVIKRQVTVIHRPLAGNAITKAIKKLGMTPVEQSASSPLSSRSKSYWRITIAGLLAITAELLDIYQFSAITIASCAILSILLSGLLTYKKGWLALWQGQLNINALMSVAVTGAAIIGHWSEAAMVMFLFNLAERLEGYSIERARNSLQSLLDLTPKSANVQQLDGSWQPIEVNAITLGHIIQIKPGEKIPLDGIIKEGYSSVNQAPITGESTPVEKRIGDRVFAGTINQQGTFCYINDSIANSTTLAKIITLVENAQNNKAPIQRFIDRFARYYTPAIFLIAICMAIIPPIFMGSPWLTWLYRALVILVIGCPCALVISTPITLVSGLTNAARHGLLVKGGEYLEMAHKLQIIAFDKTGTITVGVPTQYDRHIIAPIEAYQAQQLAASLSTHSNHPISNAISQRAKNEAIHLLSVSHFKEVLGKGCEGVINQKHYKLGSPKWLQTLPIVTAEDRQQITLLEQQGKTVVLLANESRLLALFVIADELRPESVEAISQIHQLGIMTMILTGDNQFVAQNMAKRLNIDTVYSQLLPEDKMAIIETKLAQGDYIAMVGDGINDAPALAKATIGFSIASIGSDTAIETSDVTLMSDDLRKIPFFIRLSAKTHQLLRQNIALAIGIKLLFLIATLCGLGTMWMAVFADVGTTLIVIANGLRLLNYNNNDPNRFLARNILYR